MTVPAQPRGGDGVPFDWSAGDLDAGFEMRPDESLDDLAARSWHDRRERIDGQTDRGA